MTREFLKPQKTSGLDTNAPVGKQSRFAPDPFPTRLQPKPKQPDLQTLIQRGLRLGDPMAKAWANVQPTVQREAIPEEEKEKNLQMKADEAVQREELEEEETLQTKSESKIQRQELEEEDETLQTQSESTLQREELEEEKESVQTKLTIGEPGDKYEQEADNMAAKVMSMPDPTAQNVQRQEIAEEESLQQKSLTDSITPVIQRQTSETPQQDSASQSLESQLAAEKGGGSPLSDEVRGLMEPRFGEDFSEVRVHTGSAAVQMNQQLGAQAFTHGNDIYYGKGKAPGNDALTAHELTHTIQQADLQVRHSTNLSSQTHSDLSINNKQNVSRQFNFEDKFIQRKISVSSARKNAESRIPEFINRLNQINSQAIRYRQGNGNLVYEIMDSEKLTNFDKDMIKFIDSSQRIPFRLVNRNKKIFVDSYKFATVDIDDLLGGSIASFQLNLLHILTERFETPNYEKKRRVFKRSHRLGIIRERNHLRDVLEDQTIKYTGERQRGRRRYAFTFRSRNGYRIEYVFSEQKSRVTSEVYIIKDQEQRMTLSEFLSRRHQQ